jgi:hypothetical protein
MDKIEEILRWKHVQCCIGTALVGTYVFKGPLKRGIVYLKATNAKVSTY